MHFEDFHDAPAFSDATGGAPISEAETDDTRPFREVYDGDKLVSIDSLLTPMTDLGIDEQKAQGDHHGQLALRKGTRGRGEIEAIRKRKTYGSKAFWSYRPAVEQYRPQCREKIFPHGQ